MFDRLAYLMTTHSSPFLDLQLFFFCIQQPARLHPVECGLDGDRGSIAWGVARRSERGHNYRNRRPSRCSNARSDQWKPELVSMRLPAVILLMCNKNTHACSRPFCEMSTN